MMLHTESHNKSLRKHHKMDLEGFVKLVRRVKDAHQIDLATLEQLFDSITTTEWKLCDGDSDTARDSDSRLSPSAWSVLLERARATRGDYLDSTPLDTEQCHADILGVVFDALMHAFSAGCTVSRASFTTWAMRTEWIC